MNQRCGTYHIRVEMRRPTPTQSMNTTQRSSFIILKNPMSRTKPNPTVDTEREIHKIHSGTLQGSGDTGHSPGTSRCPRSGGGETGKQKPQDACYGCKKGQRGTRKGAELSRLQEGPRPSAVQQAGPAFQLRVGKTSHFNTLKTLPTLPKN